jgi:hypothetical protein
LKNFEKVEKTGFFRAKFLLRCTLSVILGLAVLIFFKTYSCKHEFKRERKHIELKPTQKNWPIDCSEKILFW